MFVEKKRIEKWPSMYLNIDADCFMHVIMKYVHDM